MTRPSVRGDDDWLEPGEVPGRAEVAAARRGPAHARVEDLPDDDWDWDADDLEELRPPSSRARRLAIVLAGLAALALVMLLAAYLVLRSRLDPSGPPGEEVEVAIATGSTNADIARQLEDEGVVADALVFEWYLRFKGAEGFQAGDYLFRRNSAVWDALAVLEGDPLPPEAATFTVPEGLSVLEYPQHIVDDLPAFSADRIAELIATGQIPRPAAMGEGATSYEGFLFPDTYQVAEGMDEAAVLTLMTAQFDRVAAEIGLVERAAQVGLSPYEVVVVASLIQEEYGVPEEMPKIARVIYNRLEIGEPLGIDATSRYEALLAGRSREDVDFDSDSPYNTRRHAGLPPTPIAAPGRAALEAALNPAAGDWLYYVLDPNPERTPPGGHFFTASAREFEQVKAECAAAGLGCG